MNWALWLGLQRYGYIERAERIRQGVFMLIQSHGIENTLIQLQGWALEGRISRG